MWRLPSRVLSYIGSALLAVLIALSVADVFSRNFRDTSIGGTIDYVSVGMAAVVFLSLGRSEEVGAHVRTPLVTSKLPSRVAALGRGLALMIAAVVVVWLAWAAWDRALVSLDSREETPGMAGVPVWPIRLLIPVGSLLLALELAFGAVVSFAGGYETELHDAEDVMPLEGTSL